VITLNHASRWYGQVIGLNDVTAVIPTGVTALLGQNGAGKSTLMRLITGQLKPTTGEVLVRGEAPFGNPEIYRYIGYCPEIDNFYEYMTGRQFVRHMGRLAGYGRTEANRRADLAIDRVGMSDRCDRPIKGYSKGMRQRIKLAQAMLHDPEIILPKSSCSTSPSTGWTQSDDASSWTCSANLAMKGRPSSSAATSSSRWSR